MVEYGINYSDVRFIMSDNARYMTKCVREVLMPIFTNLVHGTCWAHILNLVGTKWLDIFGEVNTFVSDMKSIFVHAPARRRRYQNFLTRKARPCKLAPEPVLTRWNSWFDAVTYHAEYFDIYKDFIGEEVDEAALQVKVLLLKSLIKLISIKY